MFLVGLGVFLSPASGLRREFRYFTLILLREKEAETPCSFGHFTPEVIFEFLIRLELTVEPNFEEYF